MRRALLALFVIVLASCSDDKPQETEVLAKACEEGGAKHASGTSWTCADGCNRCSCEDGKTDSTLLACTDTDPFILDSYMPPADTSAPADTSVADTAGGG